MLPITPSGLRVSLAREGRVNRWTKAGIVVAGYVLAIVAGGVAGHLYNVRVAALPYDTSGGMYAGGEMMAELGTFLVAALVPTLLLLWFVRPHAGFWRGVAVASLGFAGVGLVAVLLPLIQKTQPHDMPSMLLMLLRVVQLMGVPLWAAAFTLFAFLAPTRPARRMLVTAVGFELVIGVCAAIHWWMPLPPL
jgi:hypothetical protein